MSRAMVRHVIWIWMENKSSATILGSPSTPFEQELIQDCALATNYHGVARPSLPNYLAATGGTTAGVSNDAPPAKNPVQGQSIFGQLTSHVLTWRSYEQSMPSNCALSSDGLYAVKHNPAAYYVKIRSQCRRFDEPMGSSTGGTFAQALRRGTLPELSFVTPNLCADTHGCPLSFGDAWLAKWIPLMRHSPAWPQITIFLTWDEGGSNQHVPCVVISARSRAGQRLAIYTDHYSLLLTTEQLLGLPPLNATVARAHSLLPLTGQLSKSNS